MKDKDGHYVYNVPSWSTTRVAAGSKIVYHKQKNADKDTLYIKGPTTEPLQILVGWSYTE